MEHAVAKVQAQLSKAERVAEAIKGQLETGAAEWNTARADFEAERQRLETVRKEMEKQLRRRDWFWFAFKHCRRASNAPVLRVCRATLARSTPGCASLH